MFYVWCCTAVIHTLFFSSYLIWLSYPGHKVALPIQGLLHLGGPVCKCKGGVVEAL